MLLTGIELWCCRPHPSHYILNCDFTISDAAAAADDDELLCFYASECVVPVTMERGVLGLRSEDLASRYEG